MTLLEYVNSKDVREVSREEYEDWYKSCKEDMSGDTFRKDNEVLIFYYSTSTEDVLAISITNMSGKTETMESKFWLANDFEGV